VQYPGAGALVAARDSSFIFGSLGTGRATLSIDGAPVRVFPNGSWLAFLPVPASGRYELVAALGHDTVRLTHPVRVLPPRPRLASTGSLVVDTASLTPRRPMMLRPDEPVRVSIRAPTNATVWVTYDSAPAPAPAPHQRLLVNGASRPVPSAGAAHGARDADTIPARYLGDSLLWATDLPAAALRGGAMIHVARATDTVTLPVARVDAATDSVRRWALLGADAVDVSDTDRVIIARPTPDGTYKWFLLPGTQVEMTGRIGEFVRVRLDPTLEVWVHERDVRALPPGFAAPRRLAVNARLIPSDDWVDVVIPVGERPPYLVEETRDALVLTLYGTPATTDIVNYARNDSLVRVVTWELLTSDRVRYTLRLAKAPYGYLVLWDSERAALVLRVRRPPRSDGGAPLRGRTIVVDPGHPGAPGESPGATGPTGLREPETTLAVGKRVQELLEARGANVVMTRTTPGPVPLGQRPIIARRVNADALVSIHLNALPDGVNPFTAQGTGTYFFHPQSEPLARAVQAGMVAHMGLRDLGVYYDNLALARPTWMPAILCEGAFLMLPEQEAALRTPEFQEAYARGIVDGLERFFRALGSAP
jgi:N-acetylmuramoyl-L-alanine amidase